MSISIWEKTSYYRDRDFVVIGAGFTGLWTALALKRDFPEFDVMVVEKHSIPQGASSRNAGFACFGSMTEIWDDAQTIGWEASLELVENRAKGLRKIIETFPAHSIDFSLCGGYELVDSDFVALHGEAINGQISSITQQAETYQLKPEKIQEFGFGFAGTLIFNALEGTLHPGKLLQALTRKAQNLGVEFLFGQEVLNLEDHHTYATIHLSKCALKARNALVCTNAFSGQLLSGIDVLPARGQILLTEKIPGLKMKGAFHFDRGYYYFRDWDERILLGGARNLNKKAETTLLMQLSEEIQENLEEFLNKVVMPEQSVNIERRWSGIMAMGAEKTPIVERFSDCVLGAVRMSGMGIALAPIVAEKIISLIEV